MINDKTQFPMDLEDVVDCYDCKHCFIILGGKETEYCVLKDKFVDYKKPCKKYEDRK